MIRKFTKIGFLVSLLSLLSLSSCHKVEVFEDDPYGNFDALWTILDERYCFFEYKEIDWEQVRIKYRKKLTMNMTSEELFSVCGDMLMELKDGHVNLVSAHDTSRYWDWLYGSPENYQERLIDEYYLNFDYRYTSGIKYKILPQNVGYMYYGSFSNTIGEGNLDQILAYLSTSTGLIIDVRSNGGGSLSNVETLVSRFINQETLVGYISHKTGPGHQDFSELYPIKYSPSNRIRYQKPVVILANRGTYSAANNFVSVMKELPQVVVMGDITGGGSGLPFSSELPNGWSIRFSASPIYDASRQHTEFGVAPTEGYKMDMDLEQVGQGHDTILDRAIAYLTGSE
ncbi:MAG TPA: S41 family peptidase [Candidatus Barnesiella excrementavium]|nr:S41 family peptidase [Candidatus Barnesiella excrementavium]